MTPATPPTPDGAESPPVATPGPLATTAPDDLVARLALLDAEVQRAIELVTALRETVARLTREKADLTAKLAGLANEAEHLRGRDSGRTRLEVEHRRLVDERRQLLGQVEGILKDLAKIDGL